MGKQKRITNEIIPDGCIKKYLKEERVLTGYA